MNNTVKTQEQDGIVLLAKKPNLTSFASLNSVKKALGTSKVGHTGTLDSFAQGLLVVCTGRLTRLAGNITAFDKSYKAVIKFGEETDTLEYTGNIIKKGKLPSEDDLKEILPSFVGNIMQVPPIFSAIHVDGKRASSLARGGKEAEIPARPITVFKAELQDVKLNKDGLVEYCLINFSVSKGTYIRSLARDIGEKLSTCAHLVGLYRTKVGDFKIEDAAGFSTLEDFTIDNVISLVNKNKEIIAKGEKLDIKPHFDKNNIPESELILQEEIRNKKVNLDEKTAKLCGFEIIYIKDEDVLIDFRNGKPLRSYMFETNLHTLPNNSTTAVFTKDNIFTGLIDKNTEGRVSYKFVIN